MTQAHFMFASFGVSKVTLNFLRVNFRREGGTSSENETSSLILLIQKFKNIYATIILVAHTMYSLALASRHYKYLYMYASALRPERICFWRKGPSRTIKSLQ